MKEVLRRIGWLDRSELEGLKENRKIWRRIGRFRNESEGLKEKRKIYCEYEDFEVNRKV